jgi:hypothetical protein
MFKKVKKYDLLIFSIILISNINLRSDDSILAIITVKENSGYTREIEYVESHVQVSMENPEDSSPKFIVEDQHNGLQISCQIIEIINNNSGNIASFRLVFPISMAAHGKSNYILKKVSDTKSIKSDLVLSGIGYDRIIENGYYRVDLSKSEMAEPKSHDSGQIRELLIKMGYNQLLTNVEDRVHWAPNFKKPELEWYTTIAHWDSPAVYDLQNGPYMVQTIRQDLAPDHPEIFLTAVYQFYENMPYFKFYSKMQMVENVWLELLRNDEMTMDSMFTHLAFQRPEGTIIDVAFENRAHILQNRPIENDSPWICFYNEEKGFAFGSIRIRYDNVNQFGQPSPVYQPHTQIGEWLGGIKYWNRRLIHDQLTFVPKGSRYIEENAYLVFRIDPEDRFRAIKYWSDRLHHPLEVEVRY